VRVAGVDAGRFDGGHRATSRRAWLHDAPGVLLRWKPHATATRVRAASQATDPHSCSTVPHHAHGDARPIPGCRPR
jgi:hypothetical protein